ncbi:hypothetical protein CFIMG_002727RA [Ceratocystis fimbriata CBS 114723]|uniref:Uncharacterized protein n=1 Tax=Ceratocystis fimbriata CBS 114723 TaxID=1035309 RepID=A0A2C5WYG0_9PEZI|nr:hypothetical protein CFIMG_002727RA [Ceratocystis fimbriata CBS 114723]
MGLSAGVDQVDLEIMMETGRVGGSINQGRLAASQCKIPGVNVIVLEVGQACKARWHASKVSLA